MREQMGAGVNSNNTNISGKTKLDNSNLCDVPQVSSEMAILAFMAEHQIPMQPLSIYGGLIYQQNITFSYRTVQNKVSDLVDRGDIKKVKIDSSEGVIRELDESHSGRAHYLITRQGMGRVEDSLNQ